MLTILSDKRTGKKIELVIPVYNEGERLPRIIKAYGNIMDIILIDDSSTDDSIEFAIKNNCTILTRDRKLEPVSFAPTEHPIVFYINNFSLSKKCIKIDADELIKISDILKITQLFDNYDIIYGNRIDVIGGMAFDIMNAVYPIAYKSNSIKCENSLHGAIQPINNSQKISKDIIKVFHLDLCVEDEKYGKMGRYCLMEINRIQLSRNFKYGIIRRFFIPIFTFSYRKVFKIKFKYYCYFLLKYIIDFLLSILIVLNKKYFGDKQAQIEKSNNFFKQNIY